MYEPMIYAAIAILMSVAMLALLIRASRKRRAASQDTDYSAVLSDAMADRKAVSVKKYNLEPGDKLRLG